MLNALDGLARLSLARSDAADAAERIEALLAQAGGGDAASPDTLAGIYEHLIRLTMHRVWTAVGDPPADPLLDAAHALVTAEADRIRDAELRERYLGRFAEHREIVALRNAKQDGPD